MNNAALAFGALVLAGLGVVVLPALAAPSYIDQYIESVTVTTTEEVTTEEITTEEITTINAAASSDLTEEDFTTFESEAIYEEIEEG